MLCMYGGELQGCSPEHEVCCNAAPGVQTPEAYLGGVDDAGLHKVLVLASGCVEANVEVSRLQHLWQSISVSLLD